MQSRPGWQLPEFTRQRGQSGGQRSTLPEIGAIPDIHAIGAGVLRHHQQLAHTRVDQALRLGQYLANRAADQSPRMLGMMQKLQR